MKILSVNPICASIGFQARIPNKTLEEMEQKAFNIQIKQIKKPAVWATAGVVSEGIINCDKFLDSNGFTYASQNEDNTVNLASGYNGGFYTIKTKYNNKDTNIKEYMVARLINSSAAFGGLLNYKECINDLKRQDIIQKGLKIHTYVMDSDVDNDTKIMIAKDLAKYLGQQISANELFFIESEAFYYDKFNKTIYGMNLQNKGKKDFDLSLKICKFETDKKGHAIGFNVRSWNVYQNRAAEEVYHEQSMPSIKLSSIVDGNNNKDFAEAFRFGNNEQDYRIRKAGPNILNHLSNRVRIKDPQIEDIKYVKFYDENKNIVKRFAYYDSSIGRSLVYDTDGKYMYQMEYNKDDFGNIIACSKF